MADEPEAPPKPAGKGIGGKLGKKLGPLPVWGWALVGVTAAVVAYRWYAAKQAASSAAASSSTAVGAGTTGSGAPEAGSAGASGSDNGYSDGGSSQLQALLAQLQSQLPSSTTSAGASLAPSTGALSGEGYGGPSGGYESAGGQNYLALTTASAVNAALGAGQTLFYQPQQGVFVPVTSPKPVPSTWSIASGGTPYFVTSPYTGASATSGAAAPTTGAAPSPVTSGPLPATGGPGQLSPYANPIV